MIASLIAWAKSLMPANPAEITRWIDQNMPAHEIKHRDTNEDKS